MAKQRRAFNFYPQKFRTDINNRETSLIDDVMFEPEQFEYRTGYVGDASILTEQDLTRTPQFDSSLNDKRKQDQLQVGTCYVDPATQQKFKGAFVDDLVNQIGLNGGLVDDQRRLFSQYMYAWSPPIDYDKFINFTRYFWTGAGDATVNGEYVTKEVWGSMTVLYKLDSGTFNRVEVDLVSSLPVSGTNGDLVELTSTTDRIIYEWIDTEWVSVTPMLAEDLPTDPTGYSDGDYLYVGRTGPQFNRPLIWMYSTKAGRWIAQPVVVSLEVPNGVEGMIWEDTRVLPARVFRKFSNSTWTPLTYTTAVPSGTPSDETYRYDPRSWSDDTDQWAPQNWWRHQNDLSISDIAELDVSDQGIRPILEFWNGIEVFASTRTMRNQSPLFQMYKYDATGAITSASMSTPIMTYVRGTGRADFPLGFALSYDNNGEIKFNLDLQTQTTNFDGYRLFKDTTTGLYHSIWVRPNEMSTQVKDAVDPTTMTPTIQTDADPNHIFSLPLSISNNPDHQVLTTVTRTKVLSHMSSVIGSQADGDVRGINSWRWTSKDQTTGAILIDPENSMLPALSLLQDPNLSVPDAIRFVSKEYSRFWTRVVRRLNDVWQTESLTDGSGNLLVATTSQMVDLIMTDLFQGRNDTYLYHYSDMGTWVETRRNGNSVTVIDSTPRPIYVPASPAKIGSTLCWTPEKFTDNGSSFLRGHEGQIIPAWGDARDAVWLALHTRMFNATNVKFRTETNVVSRRHGTGTFVEDFYDNYGMIPNQTVVDLVATIGDISNPNSQALYAIETGFQYARWTGTAWYYFPMGFGDIILTQAGEYYTYNGTGIFEINTYNHDTPAYYSTTEFRKIIRREFDRWVIAQNLDYVTNTIYDGTDAFTWNYASAGVEGNYKGIYRRVYRTVRPHSHPWEVMGYSIEPTWWRTQYTPSSTAADGTPRYVRTHAMWTDFQNGLVNYPLGITKDQFKMLAPIPVDSGGGLIDPLTLGIVEGAALDHSRLADEWQFGDGGPVEQLFYNSPQYIFACSLAGYLMRPLEWITKKWANDILFLTGVFSAPHQVRSDTLVRSPIADMKVHLAPDPVIGLNMWVADKLTATGIDVQTGMADIIHGTTPVLSWKTFGFINPNRTVYGLLDGTEIPYEDATVMPFVSLPVRSEFASGVQVIRDGVGYRVFGFDASNPSFKVETALIPAEGGRTITGEEFTAEMNQHEFTLNDMLLPVQDRGSIVSVVINGMRLRDEFVTVTNNKTVNLNPALQIVGGEKVSVNVITPYTNSATLTRRFTLRNADYFYFAEGSGEYIDIPYGTYFESPNDVFNFFVGYGRYLTTRGWQFQEYQDGDGFMQDFLAGAKQFAEWLSEITNPQLMRVTRQIDFDSFFYSPFKSEVVYESTFGKLDTVEAITNGIYGVINKRGEPISPSKLGVLKLDNTIKITSMQKSIREGENDIYGVRVNVSEAQHVVFFSQKTRFGQVIYDPVLGLAQRCLRIDTYKTQNWTGQYDAPGHIIGSGMLLPNLEKQANDFTRFYDRIDPVDDPKIREQALNLYGYYPLDSYMDQIGADERSRFDYYRGMIHAKGTIRPITAFAKGTRVGGANVKLFENWLWKTSTFGDQNREEVQFRVQHTDFMDKIQPVRFLPETTDGNPRELVIADLDRASPPSDSRWIIPTRTSDGTVSRFRFPTINGEIDYSAAYVLSLLDTTTNGFVIDHTVFDPVVGKYDRLSESLVDYRSSYDPALYNAGPKVASSHNLIWNRDHVGKIWWRLAWLKYTDYKALLPNYADAASQWGRLLYCTATISQTSDTAFVNLFDVTTGAMFSHGVDVGKPVLISISGADQTGYNVDQIYATATTGSQVSFKLKDVVGTATGNIIIRLGHVELFEWVESPVPPAQWQNYVSKLSGPDTISGEPMFVNYFADSPSYTVDTVVDSAGRSQTMYYFWVKAYTGKTNRNDFTTAQLVNRLTDPTSEGIPWFAPVDATTMIVYSAETKIKDTYAYSVAVDQRKHNSHDEWVILTEGETFLPPPIEIENKIIDCLSGQDQFGATVPDALLIDEEVYGPGLFPPQTIFQNSSVAYTTWITAINKLLKRKSLRDDPNATRYFKLADEGVDGYWTRADFRMELYEDKPVYEIVPTEDERDYRTDQNLYFNGDVVRVLDTDETDAWSGDPVFVDYLFQDGAWTEIGSGSHTLVLNASLNGNVNLFRRVYEEVKIILTNEERNDVLFSVLYEMLRQNLTCSWFLKSSFVDIQVSDTFSTAPYVRPNEIEAVINNVNDVKPFHTKIREKQAILSLSNATPDPANVGADDSAAIKTVVVFDRLNSNMMDESSWDNPYYEDPAGYSNGFWNLEDLGRQEWALVGSLTGDNTTTSYTFAAKATPSLYQQKYVASFVADGSPVVLADYGMSASFLLGIASITIQFNIPLGYLIKVDVYQTMGFYEGKETNSPYEGTYFHETARIAEANDYAALISYADPTDPDGQAPERVVNKPADHVGLVVKDYDASNNEHDFMIAVGIVPSIAAGDLTMNTSTDISYTSQTSVRGTKGYTINSVIKIHSGTPTTLVLGTDYTISFGSIVTFLNLPTSGDTVRIVYNGWPVGKMGTFKVTDTPGAFTITDGVLFLTSPVVGDTITITYLVARPGFAPSALYSMPDYVVDDALTSHLQYDGSNGFETNRVTGLRVLNTTTNTIYTWSGSAWTSTTVLSGTKVILVIRTGDLWTFNGTSSSKTYSVGDSSPGVPVLTYPTNGEGIGFGTQVGAYNDLSTHPAGHAVISSSTLA